MRNFINLLIFIEVTLLLSLKNIYIAQSSCDCDHRIQSGTRFVDGNDFDYHPGDVFCLEAGEYTQSIEFENISGSSENPITIINCGGLVSTAYIRFDNCQYFRITGTGDESLNYGILIDGNLYDRADGMGLYTFTTDFEIDHLEFKNTKAAALHLAIRPDCDPRTQRGNFVIKNINVHDNYVHDTGTEGFYFGSTKTNGAEVECDGQIITVYPVLIENIRVHHNTFINNGWDALQVSGAEKLPGALIYDNYIYNHGFLKNVNQSAGIVVGGGSSARVYNNWIETGDLEVDASEIAACDRLNHSRRTRIGF